MTDAEKQEAYEKRRREWTAQFNLSVDIRKRPVVKRRRPGSTHQAVSQTVTRVDMGQSEGC